MIGHNAFIRTALAWRAAVNLKQLSHALFNYISYLLLLPMAAQPDWYTDLGDDRARTAVNGDIDSRMNQEHHENDL